MSVIEMFHQQSGESVSERTTTQTESNILNPSIAAMADQAFPITFKQGFHSF
jgi:hypothetical protein